MWKCVDPELEWQIRYFAYGERSDVPRLQQVEQKAVGRQRNLGLTTEQVRLFTTKHHWTPKNYHRTHKNYHWTPESHHRTHFLYHYAGIFNIMLRN